MKLTDEYLDRHPDTDYLRCEHCGDAFTVWDNNSDIENRYFVFSEAFEDWLDNPDDPVFDFGEWSNPHVYTGSAPDDPPKSCAVLCGECYKKVIAAGFTPHKEDAE